MRIPTIRLAEDRDVFETRLRRLVREGFPALKLVTREDGQARRYELWHEGALIVEVDTLPIRDELEIQGVRLHLEDFGFCDAFYGMIEQQYHVQMPLVWVSLKATHPMFEDLADEQFETPEEETLRLDFVRTVRQGLPPAEDTKPVAVENDVGGQIVLRTETATVTEELDVEELRKVFETQEQREMSPPDHLNTTPELLEGWLWQVTFRNPSSPVSAGQYRSLKPDKFNATYRVYMWMCLTSLHPDDEPAASSTPVIHFEMLQLAPNKTKVVGKCVAYPEVADYFNALWIKMLREFGAEEILSSTIAEDGTKVTISPEVSMSQTFAHGYALLIGVDENHVDKWALPNVAKDIKALAKVLVRPERCAYPENHVKAISGQEATSQGILDGLVWLQECIQADTRGNTTAIVYYTGHGWRDESVKSSEFYLVPYDIEEGKIRSRALRAFDFANAIINLRPQRLLVVLDCCHAGGMGVKDVVPLPTGYVEAAIPPVLLMEGQEAFVGPGAKGMDALAQGRGRAVLSSSKGEQRSYMRRDGKMSVFTYHLIEALTGHAQPKEGATEVLVSDVMSYVWRHVPQSARADWDKDQEPDYQVSGNFPIALLLGGKGFSPDSDVDLPPAPGLEPGTRATEPVQMDRKHKQELVNALLACPTMSNRNTRDAVVNELPADIGNNIPRSPVDRVDVSNIVTRCLDYRNGLGELIETVRFFEGNSIGMQRIDELVP